MTVKELIEKLTEHKNNINDICIDIDFDGQLLSFREFKIVKEHDIIYIEMEK